LPEIRSVLQRARNNRLVLEQLLDQVPGERWRNQADGDAWTARAHLEHLATIDTVTYELLESPGERGFGLDHHVLMRRSALMAEVAGSPVDELRDAMAASREALVGHIARFDDEWLAMPVVVTLPGAYPPEQAISMRAYLASWAEHDAEHAEAIRAAITASIQPGALSAAVRIRRKDG
jgi:hypothetical protein